LFADFFPVHQVAQLKGESQCVVNSGLKSDLKSDTNSSTLLLSVYFLKIGATKKGQLHSTNHPAEFFRRTFNEQEKKLKK
jgi:hypothetical protein